ncbi:helix-turn-helix domain-containing protein [Pseudonocardia sp. DSM 110487]|uniref:PucR family transcriptional regulator n=1 Tax=Pseudonocardia sp. DSM 110487 TaxID=2865833 RepID=UPI001C69F134|nr:helix-turn-helix domain-containing protein [Pseudonocardia sp. DSM 110487]QYN33073.1 helix-turn-helix domain-containing protein [Pseudonocardia sp. DSM 110487]
MKGLLLRLSAVDADAEAAVRVIAYFDALVERGATPAELVRATAALAECPAGMDRPGVEPLRFRPDGSPASEVAITGIVEIGPDIGRVWLARDSGHGPLDDLVLERLVISARLLVVPHRRTPAPDLADPGLVELVLAEREAPEDRARALRLLGLDTEFPVRALAVAADGDPGAAAVALVTRGRPLRAARVAVIGGRAVMLLQPRVSAASVVPDLRAAYAERAGEHDAAPAVRVGVGRPVPGLEARSSWKQAKLALRFATPDDAIIDHAELGSVVLLGELPPERLRAQPDVAALDALPATDVAALEAFCRTGSLRKAAALLHLHHSSVADRLAHVENELGWSLDEPGDRFRARFALLARRLSRS